MLQLLRNSTSKSLPTISVFQISTRIRSFHKNYNPAKEEQLFKTSRRSQHRVCRVWKLLRHAHVRSAGSRYDALSLVDVARKFNIRIISPDRPGHGTSTFQQDRRLIDYPNDISQLAKYLGIARYHVIGQSGGGQ